MKIGALMRKLIILLIAFIAVVTFLRAFDRTGGGIAGQETFNGQTVPLQDAPLQVAPLQAESPQDPSLHTESGIGN